jgi:hypothetical protein
MEDICSPIEIHMGYLKCESNALPLCHSERVTSDALPLCQPKRVTSDALPLCQPELPQTCYRSAIRKELPQTCYRSAVRSYLRRVTALPSGVTSDVLPLCHSDDASEVNTHTTFRSAAIVLRQSWKTSNCSARITLT